MFKAKNERSEKLDRIGKAVLRSAVASEDDFESAANSPFLFTRIRAAVQDGQQLREEAGGWMSMILVARKAVPAMALVATLAAVLTLWSARPAFNSSTASTDDETLFEMQDPGVERTVLASRNGLSRDEIFNIVVDRNYEVKGK
jgi:hypothetical protein